MEGSIEGDFCFGECGRQIIQSGVSDDRALWDSVKDSREIKDMRAYLDKFPEGLFASVAANRINASAGSNSQTVTSQQIPKNASESDQQNSSFTFQGVEFNYEGDKISVGLVSLQSSWATTLRYRDKITGCAVGKFGSAVIRIYSIEDLKLICFKGNPQGIFFSVERVGEGEIRRSIFKRSPAS